jgi:transposase
MSKNRRIFTKEYKTEAINLAKQLGSLTAAAKQLGIGLSTLSKWQTGYRDHGQSAFPGKGHLMPADQEMRDLKTKLRRLEMENEILKKTIGYFSDRR